MKVDIDKLTNLKDAVAARFGHVPRTPSEFNLLALAISKATATGISATTLKRIWGYIQDQRGTTYTTLSLLSRYAGYDDWDIFCRNYPGRSGDSDFSKGQIIHSSQIGIGQSIYLQWDKQKSCTMLKLDHDKSFRVLDSSNIKLKAGDIVTVEAFAVGCPLMASDCIRDGQPIGSYTGARASGLHSILITRP